jgi:pimeloyl-ACP methyl ester carboxylesterase
MQATTSTSARAGADAQTANPRPAQYASRHVEANGLRLHYLDYGTEGRRPMLCVHGGAAHAHWFDFVADGFTTDHHVLSIDLRGHGDSEWVDPPSYFYRDYASDLNAAVERLDLRDFVLMGHSMGGMVALLYAASYPGRVRRLVIVDTLLNLPAERVAKLRDVGSRPGSTYASRDELESRYRLRPGHSVAVPDVVRHVAAHSGRELADGTWKLKFDRAVYGTRELHDGREYWTRIAIPALLVRGAHSERVTDAVFADAKARCPQLRLAEVPDAHHHVMLDNPGGYVAAVTPFLHAAGEP